MSPLISDYLFKLHNVLDEQLIQQYAKRAKYTRKGKDPERAQIFVMHILTKILPHTMGPSEYTTRMKHSKTVNEAFEALHESLSPATPVYVYAAVQTIGSYIECRKCSDAGGKYAHLYYKAYNSAIKGALHYVIKPDHSANQLYLDLLEAVIAMEK